MKLGVFILAPLLASHCASGYAPAPATHLQIRQSPPLPVAAAGVGVVVLFTAEVMGPMTEAWYCPGVEWAIVTDDPGRPLLATEEADCAPWEAGEEGPRRWSRRYRLGAGVFVVGIRLYKGGRTIAHSERVVEVR